jgi:hypothetical protein
MKISLCHHLSLAYYGGGEKWIINTAKELVKRGHDVEVFALPFLLEGHRKINPKELLNDIPYVEGRHHKVKADVVYVTYNPLSWMFFQTSKPRIGGIHAQSYWQKPNLRYGLLPNVSLIMNQGLSYFELRHFNAVHMVTTAYPCNHPKVYSIPDFVDSEKYHPTRNKESVFTVAYISRKVWQKGWDIFQAATKRFKTKVAGGQIKEEDMPDFISSAHVSMIPARVDTFGLAIVESFLCVHPNELMLCETNAKPIHDIAVHEKIRLGDVTTEVLKSFQRRVRDEPLYRVKGMCLLPFQVTGEHPVLVGKNVRIYSPEKRKERKTCHHMAISGTEWKKAKDLHVGDYLVFPKLHKEHGLAEITLSRPKRMTCPRKFVKAIPLNEETMELFGLYVAEGTGGNCGALSFGLHETTLVKRACFLLTKYFPYKVVPRSGKTGVQISFGGTVIGRFLHESFGRNARAKRIPDWILFSSKPLLHAFLKGYLQGDGCVTASKGRKAISFTTSSCELALLLQQAFSRFNILISLSKHRQESMGKIQGRAVNQHDSYILRTHRNKAFDLFDVTREIRNRMISYYLEDADNFYIPIRRISISIYDGVVCNVKTQSNTFTLSNIIVHNCGTAVVTTPLKAHEVLELPMYFAESVSEFRTTLSLLQRMWEEEPERYAELVRFGQRQALKYDKKPVMDKIERMFKEVVEGCICGK